MKKKMLSIIITIFTLCACTFTLTACGGNEPPHTHVYDQQVVNDTFKASNATCEDKAEYYYSCSCGEKGIEVFAHGSALGHDFRDYTSDNNASCEQDGTKTALCSRNGCARKNTIIEEGSKLIQIKAYIDNELYATLFTSKKQNYKIELPQKPQDITTNKHIEKYFYGWFSDEYCSLPVQEDEVFETNSSIYAKWIKTDSSVFNYQVSNGEATITGRKNTTQTLLVIPSFINSFPVVRIGVGAFEHEKMLKKLIICDGIEIIQSSAFCWCDGLEELFIPSSVKKIGAYAFVNCYSLFTIHWDAISCILFKDNYANDGWRVSAPFSGLTPNQTDVIIGEKVEYIDTRIFMYRYGEYLVATKFKSFVFENPQGWYRYKINSFDNMVECSMIEDINIAFVQQDGYRYGKKEYKFD